MAGYLIIGDDTHPVALAADGHGGYRRVGGGAATHAALRDGDRIWVHCGGRAHVAIWRDSVAHHEREADQGGEDIARAPMPGAVVSVTVASGAEVRAGDALMVIESMKLESVIAAPRDGIVQTIHVAVGDTFERDASLVTLEA